MYHITIRFARAARERWDAADNTAGAFAMEPGVFCGEQYKLMLIGVKISAPRAFIPDQHVTHREALLHDRKVETLAAPVAEPVDTTVGREHPVELTEKFAIKRRTDGKVSKCGLFFCIVSHAGEIRRIANDCVDDTLLQRFKHFEGVATGNLIDFWLHIFLR